MQFQAEILYGFFAFLVGCLAAIAELLSRYKNFSQILTINASRVYLLINGIASVLAYVIVLQFNIAKGHAIFQILIAGSSALLILRSSVANIKIGEKNAEIGIASILQVFLNAADRSFDQKRSDDELTVVERVMANVDFEKAKLALPTTCFTVLKNVPQEEQVRISSDVNKLSTGNLDSKTKSLNLGIILSGTTGLDLLEKAVTVLGDSIKVDGGKPTPTEQLDEILNNLVK